MPNFQIKIIETLSTVLDIEASSVDEALDIAKEKYQNEEIILDWSHHTDTEFSEFLE